MSSVIWFGVILALVVGAAVGFVLGHERRVSTIEDAAVQVEATVDPEIPHVVEQTLQVINGATVVVGPHDEILSSTAQARAFGIVRGTRIGMAEVLDAVRLTRKTQASRTLELEVNRGPGVPAFHLAFRLAAVGEGLVVVVGEDRAAAKRVEATRRDFVANVSHELKTPIGAMQLLTEAVQSAADDPEAVRHFAGKLHTESARLSELVAQIIGLSRLEAENPMLHALPIDAADIVSTSVDHCRELAEGKNVALTMHAEPGLEVLGDTKQLTEAVSNLIHNAIVYSDDGARVAVSCRSALEDDDQVVDIVVSDNGIGIARDEQQRIFERFYRVDYARSRANGGTGLGLSIVKHIAVVHGGSVSVWSQLGQGSTFTIRLPLHHPEPAAPDSTGDPA